MSEFLPWGTEQPGELAEIVQDALLQDLVRACIAHPDVDIVEARMGNQDDPWTAIVVDVGDGAVAGGNAVGIYPRERMALCYQPSAQMPFEVRALRADFPLTNHQNGTPEGEPRSLCLYDQPWSHLQRSWTGMKFLQRLLEWLARTADGTLHEPDQALEQVFFDSPWHVVLPVDFNERAASTPLQFRKVSEHAGRTTYIASFATQTSGEATQAITALTLSLAAVGHPPIQRPPLTLGELADRLAAAGSDLRAPLEGCIRDFAADGVQPASGLTPDTLLMLDVPRARNGLVERVDPLGFLISADVAVLGQALGVLQEVTPNGKLFPFQPLWAADAEVVQSTAWRDLPVCPVHVRRRLGRAAAATWSGLPQAGQEFHGVLAGAGALGSGLAQAWARSAWGHWHIIDPDILEPHNVIRHGAFGPHIGIPKAMAVATMMDLVLQIPDVHTTPIAGSAAKLEEPDIAKAISEASVLVDATTTIDVPRTWANSSHRARCASVFITPSGFGAVLLVEDAARRVRLDAIEAQYYRAILRAPWGGAHLAATEGRFVGLGCRDRSLVMSSTQVSLQAAILDHGLRSALGVSGASVRVWTTDPDNGAVAAVSLPVMAEHRVAFGEWTVCWDEGLETILRATRDKHLPSETGGILVGMIDQKSRTVYVVDAFEAPADSQASSRDFIRGREGVSEAAAVAHERTRGMVNYVGDWHSHPQGTPPHPSGLDCDLLRHLGTTMGEEGLPAIMVIVGHAGEVSVHLAPPG